MLNFWNRTITFLFHVIKLGLDRTESISSLIWNKIYAFSAFIATCSSYKICLSSSSTFFISIASWPNWSTRSSSFTHSSDNVLIFSCISLFYCSAIKACLIPYAIDESYNPWYAANYYLNSSLTRTNKKPRSAQLIVICLITSSKHC